MKKGMAAILTCIFALALAACESGAETADETTAAGGSETAAEVQEDGAREADAEESAESGDIPLEITHKLPGHNIYVDAPNFQEIELGYTELFTLTGEKYIAVTGAKKSVAADCEEAHEVAFEKFVQNMDNFMVNTIDISEGEVVEVGGLEAYRFVGTINYGCDTIYDGYAVGYAFIMEDMPCEIIGSVTAETQSEDLINEVTDLVDRMMETVRTEE